MKKLLSLLAVFTAVICFANEAKAGLSIGLGFNIPIHSYRSYDDCDYGYRRAPVVYYNSPRYYRPRHRVVYYDSPSYYTPRYSYYSGYSSYRGCR